MHTMDHSKRGDGMATPKTTTKRWRHNW